MDTNGYKGKEKQKTQYPFHSAVKIIKNCDHIQVLHLDSESIDIDEFWDDEDDDDMDVNFIRRCLRTCLKFFKKNNTE